MAQILLTGGAGYIGSHTYLALVAAGHRVVIFDNFSNAAVDVPDRLELITGAPVPCVTGDILDPAALAGVFADHSFDAVVHFAALKAVAESVENPLAYFRTNIGGLLTLLEAMEGASVRRLVFSSSATVYGAPDQTPTPETAPRRAMNPYGQTKITGEEILEQLAKSDPRWAVGILRYFNPAGAHGSALIGEDPSDIPNNLMPYIARLALGDLDCLSVFGDDYATPDGTGVRDYIHVDDLAQGHALSLAKLLETGQGHLVNLGTGQGSRSTAPMRPPVAGRCLTKSPPVVQAMYRSIAPTLHRRARCWALRPRKIWRPCAPPAGPGSRDGAMGEGGGSSVLAMRRKRTLQSLVKWFKVGQEMHRNCAPFP